MLTLQQLSSQGLYFRAAEPRGKTLAEPAASSYVALGVGLLVAPLPNHPLAVGLLVAHLPKPRLALAAHLQERWEAHVARGQLVSLVLLVTSSARFSCDICQIATSTLRPLAISNHGDCLSQTQSTRTRSTCGGHVDADTPPPS